MLKISCSSNFKNEKEYIFDVLLKDFLGLDFFIVWGGSQQKEIIIELEQDANLKKLVFWSCFFEQDEKNWLQKDSLPKEPVLYFDQKDFSKDLKFPEKNLPVFYGENKFSQNQNTFSVAFDIFGSAFIILTRYEEAVLPDRDQHDRFPAQASLLYKEKILDRPIVNEYLEWLWCLLKNLWPNLKRKKREYSQNVTCDVDKPYDLAYFSNPAYIKRLVAKLVKHRSWAQFKKTIATKKKISEGHLSKDPYYTFDEIMSLCEKYNTQNSFYFICDHSGSKRDGYYSMDEPLIQNLLKNISNRGHEIGMHGSYKTYRNQEQIRKEFLILQKTCEKLSITQEKFGGRQHYLRWDPLITPKFWNDVGLIYDSTLGFASYAGFRAGVCYEFQMYDLKNRQALKLIQKPLILMECSVMYEKYMNLGETKEAISWMILLREKCKKYNGLFTWLWHNSEFTTLKKKEFFIKLLEGS